MPQPTEVLRKPGADASSMRRGVVILLLVVFAGLVFFRGLSIWWRYEDVTHGAQENASRLAHVLTEHLQQTVATIDATLRHLAAHSMQVGGPEATPEDWNNVLVAAISGLKSVERLTVIDRFGEIRHSSQIGAVGEKRGNHPLFQMLVASQAQDLISRGSFRDPVTGRPMVPLARRLTSLDGHFDGIVAALLNPHALGSLYREIEFGPRSIVAILTRDGEVLYRHGPAASLTKLADSARSLAVAPDDPTMHDTLALRGAVEPNGPSYFTAVHGVGNSSLTIAVSLAEDDVLRVWRNEFYLSLGILGTVAFLFLIGGVLVSRVLHARDTADTALKQNEARFYEIMYRAPILVSVKDAQGRVKFINKALEDLFGSTWSEVRGKRLKDIQSARIGPADMIAALDQEVIDTKTPVQRELTYQSRNGTRTAMFVKFPLLDENGEVDSIASFSVDLTEQRRATTWFSTIMDHAPAFIAVKDFDGRFVFVNRALAAAVGLEPANFLGRNQRDLFPPDYVAVHEQFDREVIEARAPIQREFTAPYATGVRTLLFLKFPIFDAKGDIESIGVIATDISKQKQAEKQLAHAQRMEAVGQLTGGIAHDFNNLLTVMIGNSELLAEELSDNERLQPLARLTLEAAERSAVLTQRLLAFGRRQMLEPKSTDVLRLVDEMEALCKRAAGVRVHVEVRHPDETLWPAMVDAGQLETAIINLVVNSRDAMPDGGRVVIELGNVEIDDSYVEINPDAKRGDYVMIAVSDTGTGMTPDVVARVFEPFFTTKEAGKGTGLGLPTVYGFIKQSGGHIKIYSEFGHGTTVRLYIPRANAPSIVPEIGRGAAAGLPRGHESILLVEDDRIVRDYTETQLLDLGYRVTTAANPEEAVRLARLTGKPDLLITDVVMEGSMNGRQLAEWMRARWPDVKVLCVSGYTDGVLPEVVDGKTDGLYFLSKPFRRRDLALKVREVLDELPVLVD